LFFEDRTRSKYSSHAQIRLSRDYGEDAYRNAKAESKKQKGKAPSLSSLSGKMSLSTHLWRHSSVHGEIPISPPLPDDDYALPTAETLSISHQPASNSARFSAFYPKKRSTSSSKLRVRKFKPKTREETKTLLACDNSTHLASNSPSLGSKSIFSATGLLDKSPIDRTTESKDITTSSKGNKFGTSKRERHSPPEQTHHTRANISSSAAPQFPHEPGYRKPATEPAAVPHHKPSSSQSSSSTTATTPFKPAGPLHDTVHRARASVSSVRTIWPRFHERAASGSSHGTASDHDARSRGEETQLRRHASLFLAKAVGARKEKGRERRREELKRSIRVVGEVDPRSVESSEDTVRRMAYAERAAGEKGRGGSGSGSGGKRDTFGEGWV